MKLNYNKIKKINNKDYFYNIGKTILIVDIRYSKIKIFAINQNKCIFSITSGLIFKKLNLSQKKLKKSDKMLKLIIKTAFMRLKNENLRKNIIIHIKGTKSNLFNILLIIEKTFYNHKFVLMYSPYISYGRFKFKKIKAIKRRLRKKFVRLIKK